MPKRLRARELLRQKVVWVPPILIGVILIGLMTALYIGSAVDPVDHMEGLPVSLVQRDAGGSSFAGLKVNLGRQVEGGCSARRKCRRSWRSTSSRWRRRKTGWTAAPPTPC